MSMCIERSIPQLTYAQAVARMSPASCPIQRTLSLPNHNSQGKPRDAEVPSCDDHVIDNSTKHGQKRDLVRSSSQACPKTEKISRMDSFSDADRTSETSHLNQCNSELNSNTNNAVEESDSSELYCQIKEMVDHAYLEAQEDLQVCSACDSFECICDIVYSQGSGDEDEDNDEEEIQNHSVDTGQDTDVEEEKDCEGEEDEEKEDEEDDDKNGDEESDDNTYADEDEQEDEEEDDEKEDEEDGVSIADADSNNECDENDEEEDDDIIPPILPPRLDRQNAVQGRKGPDYYAQLYSTGSDYSSTRIIGPVQYSGMYNFDEDSDEDDTYLLSIGFGHETGYGYAFPKRGPTTIKKLAEFWENDFQVSGFIYPKMADWEKKGVAPKASECPKDYKRYLVYKCLYNKWIDCQKDIDHWWNLYSGRSLAAIACMKKKCQKYYPAHHPKAVANGYPLDLDLPKKKPRALKRTPWIWRDNTTEEYDPLSIFFSETAA